MESALCGGVGEMSTIFPVIELPLKGANEIKLIETLLWDGKCFPRLALHVARMRAGVQSLGWSYDIRGFENALEDLRNLQNQKINAQVRRVRVTLDAMGQIICEVNKIPLSKAFWRVTLADERIASSNPWLRIKSTNRSLYDNARSNIKPDIDEIIFANERDEVCEGTITNVFFDKGSGMRSPPLLSGVLPGVLRAELNCPEEILRIDELYQTRIWVGNAIRGLIPAIFV